MANNSLQFYDFEGSDVRIIGDLDNPWWVAADICKILEIQNPSQAMNRLDEDEKAMLNIGLPQEAWCVNESGLYALIVRSRKPQAKRFRKWVTSEVLPSIRKTGSYSLHQVSGVGEVSPADFPAISMMFDLALKGVVDDHLIAGAKLESFRKECPKFAGCIDQAKSLLPIAVEARYLTVTEVAQMISDRTGKHLSKNGTSRGDAIELNKLLIDKGLQMLNTNKEPKYLPTDQGKEFCDVHLQTAKGHNRTCQGLRWKPTVIDLLVS